MKKDIIVCQSYYRAVEKRKQEELMKKRIKTDNELKKENERVQEKEIRGDSNE